MQTPPLSNRPVYSIGTVARMLNVAVQTLRMYEREGLILPSKSPGNQRLYSEADLERLRCIRRAIAEERIGIEGIRRIQSLIPCWDIVGCSESDRRRCPSFRTANGACWSHPHAADMCNDRDCRTCPVYSIAIECGSIKNSIIDATNGNVHALTP